MVIRPVTVHRSAGSVSHTQSTKLAFTALSKAAQLEQSQRQWRTRALRDARGPGSPERTNE